MASPAPPLKRSKRQKKPSVKLEQDMGPPDMQGDVGAVPGRRQSKRAALVREPPEDEAGPSSHPQSSRRTGAAQEAHLATPDELAHLIRQRDFYKAEAETVGNSWLSHTEKEQLIGAVMRHMLFKQRQKPSQPVRSKELANIFKESGKQGSGLSTYVIAQAQARFADAFGLEMKVVELVPDKMAGKSEAELRGLDVKTSKAYVMRSLLPAKCRELVRAPDVSQAFAMLVLSLIDLSPSKKLSAEALWEHLSGLCLKEKEEHPAFGWAKPEDQIAAMLKKRYIMEVKPGPSDGPGKAYCACDNALDEIPEDDMDSFADQVLRDAAIEIRDDSPEAEA